MTSEYKCKFEEIGSLGCGGFSMVFEAKSIKDGKSYAIKKIPFKEEEAVKALKEIIFFGELESDYVVRYVYSWVERNYYISEENSNNLLKPEKPLLLHIQMEMCSMTLNEFIKSFHYPIKNKIKAKDYSIACELFIQLLQCVQYLHQQNPPIIHRDLKPQNILLTKGDNNLCVKLTDFGLSTFHEYDEQSHTTRIGTDGYKAPEVITSKHYTTKADIYSLGRIMEKLFNIDFNSNPIQNSEDIQEKYEKFQKICSSCLLYINNQRPNCNDILNKRNEWLFIYKMKEKDLFAKINELIYETEFMSIIEEIDNNIYSFRVSDQNDNPKQKPIIVNELSNKQMKRIIRKRTHLFERNETTNLLRKYPNLYKVYEENSTAVLYAFKKKGLLKAKIGNFELSTEYAGSWSKQKSWEDYKTFMQSYVDKLMHDDNGIEHKTELSKARNDICKAIYTSHSNTLPDWPTIFTQNTGRFELNANGSYRVDNIWVLWQALGWMIVTDRATHVSYHFSFSGNPEITLAMIDLFQLQNLEALLAEDFDNGKESIMKKAENASLIFRNWNFL